jgi:23S rRNA (uracil1939-C5)-methyltransferase
MSTEERLPTGASAEITVRSLAGSGAGVADLPDGRIVFVPRSAPGDRIRVRLGKSKKKWAEGEVEEVLEAGPNRRAPLCALYDRCGGCSLQHVPDAIQIEWKSRFVADALRRIGGVEIEAPEVVPSPRATGYRNRITFTLRRLRGGRLVAGFHALGRPAHVVDVRDECVLPEAELLAAWSALREGWGGGARHLPEAGRLRLTLRNTTAGVGLTVEGGAAGWSARALAESVPLLAGIWHRPTDATETALVRGEPLTDQWGDDSVPVGGRAFLQVNREGAVALRDHLLAVAGASGGTAVDAYCGVGFHARALARAGWEVTGIETDPDAVLAARTDAPEGFTVREGRVEDLLDGTLPAELLVLNPPRTGLDARVPAMILASPPQRILYVSCDPATLARDVARLADGYEVGRVRAFDLFPQTGHVETVLELTLRGDPE